MQVIVIGADEVADDLRNADVVFRRTSNLSLTEIGNFTVRTAKANIVSAGAVDLGELHQGVYADYDTAPTYTQVTVRPSENADRYAVFVEYGTRPHTPPASALQGWSDRHGIPVWAVIRKISREGTEPRHTWRDTFATLLNRVDRDTRQFANRLGESL